MTVLLCSAFELNRQRYYTNTSEPSIQQLKNSI